MKLISIATIISLFITGSASSLSAKQKAEVEREIRPLDAERADAILRGDLAALNKIWTTDFKVNNPFNEVGNAKRIRTGVVAYSSFGRVAERFWLTKTRSSLWGRERVVPRVDSHNAGKAHSPLH